MKPGFRFSVFINVWWIKKERHKRQKQNEKLYLNRERNQRFYQSEWKNLRLYKLSLNPCCERCAQSGYTNVYDLEVHHRIPINSDEGWKNRQNPDHLETLCRSCHQKETVREQKERRDQEKRDTLNRNMERLSDFETS